MIQRNFKLALTAGWTIPLVIPASQYDSGEQWIFTLIDETGAKYTPESGAIIGIKSDKMAILNAGTVDAAGRVVINETEQMTAAVGKNVFEILINDQTHGSANFIVMVEPRPGDQADFSESDLSLLEQAIEGTSAAAIAHGVQTWMDDNLTSPTNPIVDASLSLSGAAADAKKTGDEISALKSALNNISVQTASTNILNPISESGYYDISTGAKKNDSGYIRTVNATKLPDDWTTFNVIAKNQFTGTVGVFFYSSDSTDSFNSRVGVSNLTISTVNIPSGCHYVRLSMPIANSFADLSIAKSNVTTFEKYLEGRIIKNSAISNIGSDNLSDALNADIALGAEAIEKFTTILSTGNMLPPDQENGYYTGTVGQTLTKNVSNNHVRTPSPIPFDSFTGEYKLILKNAISGGGYAQIFFLADDANTIVFTQSVNSANALTLHDYVPSTAKFFVVWANKGNSNFSISDICITKENDTNYTPYQISTTLNDYTNHEKVLKSLNDSKNIVVFGDSIFGMVDDETGVSGIMRNYTNANIINCAFGGTRLSIRPETNGYEQFDFGNLVNCVVSGDYSTLVTTGLPSYYPSRKNRLSHVDFSKVDTVILYYGTNDYMSGVTEEGVLACANYIKTLQIAFPQIKVVYCSPAFRVFFDNEGTYETDSNSYNPSRGTLRDYCAWYKEMAESINIEFIDCYNIGINAANYAKYFTSPDGVHHNANGRAYLGEYLGKRMLLM